MQRDDHQGMPIPLARLLHLPRQGWFLTRGWWWWCGGDQDRVNITSLPELRSLQALDSLELNVRVRVACGNLC
jgi:hypothetical protein